MGDADAGTGTVVQWGTVRLENAGGAWEGRLSASPLCPVAGTSSRSGTGGPAATPGWPTSSCYGFGPLEDPGPVFPGDPPPPYAEGGTTIARPEAGGPVADDAVAVVTGTADCPGLDL